MTEQFFTSQIDWLDVWDICGVDLDRIERIRERSRKSTMSESTPFVIRVATGDVEDQSENDFEGGVSIDIFDADRAVVDQPITTIRIPWDTARMIGSFLHNMPDCDPSSQ